METILSVTLIAGPVLLLAALLAALVIAWRRGMSDSGPLPFFRKLEGAGLTIEQAEESIGLDGLTRAVRRCAFCGEKEACKAGLLRGWIGRKPVDCPNEQVFERVRGFEKVETP
jgi:hypothetical protein